MAAETKLAWAPWTSVSIRLFAGAKRRLTGGSCRGVLAVGCSRLLAFHIASVGLELHALLLLADGDQLPVPVDPDIPCHIRVTRPIDGNPAGHTRIIFDCLQLGLYIHRIAYLLLKGVADQHSTVKTESCKHMGRLAVTLAELDSKRT